MTLHDPQDDTKTRQDTIKKRHDKTREQKRREEKRRQREDKDKDKDKGKTKTDKDTTKRRPDKDKTWMTKNRQHRIRKTTEQELREADEQTKGETKLSLPLITAGPK